MTEKVIQMPGRKKNKNEPLIPLKDQRDLAKLGMVASMGTLLVTGFMGRKASRVHICSGVALIGFSYWHYRLYQPKYPAG